MQAGDDNGYLKKIKPVSIDDSVPEGMRPTGRALRAGNYFVCNDIENESNLIPWKAEALRCNFKSSIAVPIKKFGKVVGAFNVYASEKKFFDSAEIALLEEATNDVSFALEIFEKEALRKKAEEAVVQSE
jgi:GAF domain-containing protein